MRTGLTLVLIFSGLIAAGAIAADSYHASSAAAVCQAPAVSQAAPGGLLSASPKDVENPCDPTPAILSGCKAMHGHFSTSCCCCITH